MSELFKDPNTVTNSFGKLTIKAHLRTIKNLEETCSAMERVAESEDDSSKRGNYTRSFENLMNAFDTFLTEYYCKIEGRSKRPESKDLYNLKDPVDLTIRLFWEIRHISVHKGGMPDKKCKDTYENILAEAENNDIHPILDMPKTIQIGKQFSINKEDYYKFKEGLFQYIGKLIPSEDRNVLRNRSGITNVVFHTPMISILQEGDDSEYLVRYEDLVKIGMELNWKDDPPTLPLCIIDKENQRIIFLTTGDSVKTVMRPKVRWPEKYQIKKK